MVLNTYSFAADGSDRSASTATPTSTHAWPPNGTPTSGSSISIPVPLDQIHDGPNTITFKSGDPSTTVSNISIILVAASPVP